MPRILGLQVGNRRRSTAALASGLALVCGLGCTAGRRPAARAGTVARPPQRLSRVVPYPDRLYRAALDHMEDMPQHSTALGAFLPSRRRMRREGLDPASAPGAWEWLGPGNIGGRTRAIVIDPTNTQVLYAAGVTGGVWKSTNGGARWTPLTDLLPNLTVSCLAMDPRDPAILYAGTGEMSNYFGGDGIFKTTDGGSSWAVLAQTEGSPDFKFVQKIAVSPNDSRRIYAATSTGVWRSLDGGSSWTHSFDPPRSSEGYSFCDLAIRTDRAEDVALATFSMLRGGPGGIYRNLKAAATDDWTLVYADSDMWRTSLAIAPSDEDVAYAVASSKEDGAYHNGLLAVLKSTDGGTSWSPVVRNTDATLLNTLLLSSVAGACLTPPRFRNQGYYDEVIAVDPTDANRVWVGGINLFESLDGGISWGVNECCGAGLGGDRDLHVDYHALVFDPGYDGAGDQRLYVGSDGGLARIENAASAIPSKKICGGAPWGSVSWAGLNHNYGITQFYAGAPTPDGRAYYGGTQDNGILRGDDASGTDGWSYLFDGDGFNVAIDRTHPATVYGSILGMHIYKSDDRGASWKPVGPVLEDSDLAWDRVPLVIDGLRPNLLWTASRRLWRTTDGAETWSPASAPLTDFDQIPLTAATGPAAGSRAMLLGDACGKISRIPSADSSTETEFPVPAEPLADLGFCAAWVTSLTWDAGRPGVGYATFATNYELGGAPLVWTTVDGGISWSPLAGSGATALPEGIDIATLWVDPRTPETLYAGTELGVFISTDGGRNWAVEHSGFPNVRTNQLSSTPDGCTLFAFTHGRGVYRARLRGGPCRGEPAPAPGPPSPAPVAGRGR